MAAVMRPNLPGEKRLEKFMMDAPSGPGRGVEQTGSAVLGRSKFHEIR